MMEAREKIIIVRYQDDGPRGICGQSATTTSPWDQLHIFFDEEAARQFVRQIDVAKGRTNPRVTGIYHYPEGTVTNGITFHTEAKEET